jgi:hypothetical protein
MREKLEYVIVLSCNHTMTRGKANWDKAEVGKRRQCDMEECKSGKRTIVEKLVRQAPPPPPHQDAALRMDAVNLRYLRRQGGVE